MTAYLQKVKPDAVFAFFGYNESFEGKADEYKKQLLDFVKKTRGAKPNGKSFPRIVLFSPIAHEDTRNPNVPDGSGAQRAARSLHEGDRGRGEGSGRRVCGSVPSVAGAFQKREDAAHDQRRAPFRRRQPPARRGDRKGVARQAGQLVILGFRCARRYSTRICTGGTATTRPTATTCGAAARRLKFRGRTRPTPTVLQHELKMLDVMTANRDERVWARAERQGQESGRQQRAEAGAGDLECRRQAARAPTHDEGRRRCNYISGEEAIKHMAVAKGFKVNLFADEKRFPAARESRADAVRHEGPTVGRGVAELSEMGTAQADERRADHSAR